MIGVLGGMGPAAQVDFLAKLVRLTPAERDHDHVAVVVVSHARVPERVARSWKGRPSPLPALRAEIRTLEHAGGACIAIPSHTAHYWYEEMLLACTELPLVAAAASGPVCLDAPEALARACIAWHQEHGRQASDLAVSTGN
jgi:aspartate racemase